MIDQATHPCVDFYHHVCDKWTMRYNVDTIGISKRNAFKTVTNALLLTSAKSTVTLPRSFREFYTACYSFLESKPRSSLSALLQPLRGHADILSMGNFSLFLEHAIFLSLEWGIDVVFTLGLVGSMDSTHLRISPARNLLGKLDPNGDSPNLMDQLRPLLDFALAGTTLTTSAATILELDKALKHDAADEPAAFSPVTILNRLENFLHITRWLRCINSLLPTEAHVNAQSMLVTDYFNAIERGIATIYSASSDGLVYAFLQVLAELARFNYHRSVHSDDAPSASACFFAGAEVFGHSWARMFIELTSSGSSCKRTETIFRQLVTLTTSSRAFAWTDETSRNRYRILLSGVRLYLYGDTDAAGSDATWGPSFVRWEAFPEDFLLAKREAQKRSLRNPRPLLTNVKDSLLYSGRVSYSGSLRAVVVPPISSSWPFCTSEEVPVEFDLGMLGVLMATEMSRAAFAHFRSGARLLENRSELGGFSDCIRPIAQAVLGAPLGELSGRVTTEAFLWVRGVRLAQQLLSEALSKAATVDAQGWRNAHATFFMRFCRLTCGTRTEPGGLSAEARCLLPLANIPEFPIAFQCPVPSRMTHKSCEVL
ncbi:hypothetical protein HPB48_001105 [Haemaphysalis longicornis]|uniref:Uncharacterized protein n=1 Tax=Haemaphysalis longicornis TaxID=44386 RepID=A0A9J6GGM1_HAELO|nr:hypothetical protein HPB48_001105 [Haemaphysalis longicornis]